MHANRKLLPGVLAVFGASLVAASIPTAASAATHQRYVSPAGSGYDCTAAKP